VTRPTRWRSRRGLGAVEAVGEVGGRAVLIDLRGIGQRVRAERYPSGQVAGDMNGEVLAGGAGDGELELAGVRASSTGCPCGCCKASAGPAPGTASKGSDSEPTEWESVLRAWAMTWACYFCLLPPYSGGFSRKASDSGAS
jgi:hypothetical protein